MHFIPIEKDYVKDGRKSEHLRIENSTMLQLMSECIHLEDKKPSYEKEKNKYSLNFQGRANASSVKNTQLVYSYSNLQSKSTRKF